MIRITNYGQGQALIAQMLRNQEGLAVQQERVSTGKQVQEFKDVGGDTGVLLAAKSAIANLEGQDTANLELMGRLEVTNVQLGELAGIADQVRQDLIQAVNLNSGTGLMDRLRGHYERATELLNSTFQGRYLFGGGQSASPRVAPAVPAALAAVPASGDVFDNGTRKAVARIDDTQTLQYGELANEIAPGLFDLFHRLFAFDGGSLPAGASGGPAGPFGDPLASGQSQFLIGEFDRAVVAAAEVRTVEARNGVHLQTLSEVIGRSEGDLAFMRGFVSDIEDADMAEALSQLQLGETALQASLQMVARLGRLSLVDFI